MIAVDHTVRNARRAGADDGFRLYVLEPNGDLDRWPDLSGLDDDDAADAIEAFLADETQLEVLNEDGDVLTQPIVSDAEGRYTRDSDNTSVVQFFLRLPAVYDCYLPDDTVRPLVREASEGLTGSARLRGLYGAVGGATAAEAALQDDTAALQAALDAEDDVDGGQRWWGIDQSVGLDLTAARVDLRLVRVGTFAYGTNYPALIRGDVDGLTGRLHVDGRSETVARPESGQGDLTTGSNQILNVAEIANWRVGMWVQAFNADGDDVTFDRTDAGGYIDDDSAKVTAISGSTLTIDGESDTTLADATVYVDQNLTFRGTGVRLDDIDKMKLEIEFDSYPGGGAHIFSCTDMDLTVRPHGVTRGPVVPKGACRGGRILIVVSDMPAGSDDLCALNMDNNREGPEYLNVTVGKLEKGPWTVSGGNETIVARGAKNCLIDGGPIIGGKSANVQVEDARGDKVHITDITNASPAVVTTEEAHGYETGLQVVVQKQKQVVSANGLWTITVLDAHTFRLDDSDTTGDPAFVAGGSCRWNVATEDCTFRLDGYDAGGGVFGPTGAPAHGIGIYSAGAKNLKYFGKFKNPDGAGIYVEAIGGGELTGLEFNVSLEDTGQLSEDYGLVHFAGEGVIEAELNVNGARCPQRFIGGEGDITGKLVVPKFVGQDCNLADDPNTAGIRLHGLDAAFGYVNLSRSSDDVPLMKNGIATQAGEVVTYGIVDIDPADVSGNVFSGNVTPSLANALTTALTHSARLAATPVAGLVVRETGTGLLYRGNGTSWDVWKAQGLIVATADQTINNSASLANDSELFFPIEANEKWFVLAYLDLSGASATADWKFDWNLPSAGTWKGMGGSAHTGVADTSVANTALTTSTQTFSQINGEQMVVFAAWLTNASTAGIARFRLAQNTATAENSVRKAGSLLRLERIA